MVEIKKEEVQVGDCAYVKSENSLYNGYQTEVLEIESRYNEYSGEEYKVIRCDDGYTYRLSDGICISETETPRVFYKLCRKTEEYIANEQECINLLGKQEDYYNYLGEKIISKIKEIIKAESPDVPDEALRVGFSTGYESLHINVLLSQSPYTKMINELREKL